MNWTRPAVGATKRKLLALTAVVNSARAGSPLREVSALARARMLDEIERDQRRAAVACERILDADVLGDAEHPEWRDVEAERWDGME